MNPKIRFTRLSLVLLCAVAIGVHLTTYYHFLLFHSLVEIYSITVAFTVFIIAWNSKSYIENNFLLLIGMAFFIIGLIDTLHTLSYEGMNIFKGNHDYATQLWVVARFFQSVAILVGFCLLRYSKKINVPMTFFTCLSVAAVTLLTIFYWKIFPQCFIPGSGLTEFKVNSEYVICLILIFNMYLLQKNSIHFEKKVYGFVFWSLVFSFASELSFTFYVSIYGLSNQLGHFMKLFSFYLIYRAVVETGISRPYDVVFRELKLKEESLRVATKMAEDANSSKGDFLAHMSHEIRTPMNAITGMAHLALKTGLSSQQKNYILKIQSSSVNLLGLINDILDFSKIEAGRLTMESVEFKFEDVLEHLSTVVEQDARKKKIELLLKTTDVPQILVGDSLRLGQVLINLVTNAIRFTDSGDVVVSTEVLAREDNRILIKFSVSDDGIGMSRAQAETLFEPFVQGDSSTARKYGGTGLGLSISKLLVELMGGGIWVEEKEVKGTSILFTAWFGLADKVVKEEVSTFKKSDFDGINVLVVDDNAMFRDLISAELNGLSMNVRAVDDAVKGIEQLKESDFQLLLIDYCMPGMDGISAAVKIRSTPGICDVKIIIVTSYDLDELREMAEAARIDGFLRKPVTRSCLVPVLRSSLGLLCTQESINRSIEGKHVLLVEDNIINQEIVRELLESAGVTVTIADYGKDAVEMIATCETLRFDLILMDIQMPEMGGFEATRKIRRVLKDRDLPIIGLSALTLVEDKQRCLDAGMVDHLSKPIDLKIFFATLNRWLPQKAGVALLDPGKSRVFVKSKGLKVSGVDVKAGLSRVAGNRSLYLYLLSNFLEDQSSVDKEIRNSVDRGDFKGAAFLVHSLKGQACSLGAVALCKASEDLENSLLGREAKDIGIVLDLLSMELNEFSIGVRKILNNPATQVSISNVNEGLHEN